MPLYYSQPIVEFVVPGTPPIANITIASNGDVWFAGDSGQNVIGRIVPATSIMTLFSVGTPGDSLGGINVGSDGNIYVSNNTQNQIHVVQAAAPSPGNLLATYSASSTGVGGIVQGSDGNMWFMDGGANQVGKITPQGVVTKYTNPTGGANAHGPNLGPDGNVWYCEGPVNQVAKITPQGTITEYATPTTASNAFWINQGPDGNMWYTKLMPPAVGRISLDGTSVTEWQTPNQASQLSAIWTSTDRTRLYFIEKNANQIAYIPATGGNVVTVLQKAINTNLTGGTSAATLGASVTGGSLLLAFAGSFSGSQTLTGPAGFSQVGNQVNVSGCCMATFAKIATGAEGRTFGASSANATSGFEIRELKNAVTIDQFVTATVTGQSQITLGPVTPSTAATYMVAGIFAPGGGAYQNSFTSGFTRDDLGAARCEFAYLLTSSQTPISTTESVNTSKNMVGTLVAIKATSIVNPIKEILLPTASAVPDKIIANLIDGRMWFTEHGSGKVGALTPVQWFTYQGPFDAEMMVGDEYPGVIKLLTGGASTAVLPSVASQLAAENPSWFTFYP